MPVGCRFPLHMRDVQNLAQNKKYPGTMPTAILQTELPDNQTLTVESCIASCSSQGFTLAGLEYSVQCCMFDEYLI